MDRPAPLVPPHVDLRGIPIPREAFARMAVLHFGISIEEARAHVGRVADALEQPTSTGKRRRR